MPPPAVRPYRDEDRALALELGLAPAVLEAPHCRVFLAEPPSRGVALWKTAGGDGGCLAYVTVKAGGRRVFYELARACCADAVAAGLKHGYFLVTHRGLLQRLGRDFHITATVEGWDAATNRPAQWEVRVGLADALAQLDRVI